MRVFIRQAGVVVDERVATVDADDAERPGWIGAPTLWRADVVAGRSGGVPRQTNLAGQEGTGGGEDRGERQ